MMAPWAGFTEALTRVEFLQTQSDVLLGSNVSYAGSALIGTQLYSIARYILDFVDYAFAAKEQAQRHRGSATNIRVEYGLLNPADGIPAPLT